MTAAILLSRYLNDFHTMQIATTNGDRPWVCTVHFISDTQHNLYWFSIPSRRHSKEIEQNPNIACAIVVNSNIGEPVIGVQIEGSASVQEPSAKNRPIAEKYADKFLRNQKWIDDFVAGKTEHRLYKLTPTAIYLFDEKNFPGGQKQKVV